MMNGTENNVTVNLEKPIPVLIIYGTVAVDDKNNVFFFDHVYSPGLMADLYELSQVRVIRFRKERAPTKA
jgi:murein L,D-transpeptidase YcbB/YkuD